MVISLCVIYITNNSYLYCVRLLKLSNIKIGIVESGKFSLIKMSVNCY